MKKLLATILAAGMVMSLAACGKEPEQSNNVQGNGQTVQGNAQDVQGGGQDEQVIAAPQISRGWEGEYYSNDTEEHFKIFNVTDTGFTVEFYHFEEGRLEKFDYEMEFDDAEKKTASEKGTLDENGGWEYTFYFGGDTITVTWQQYSQAYSRVN